MQNHSDFDTNAQTAELAEAPAADREKPVRKKLSQLYNTASLTLLIQFGIASMLSAILAAVYSVVVVARMIQQDPNMDPELLAELTLEAGLNPMFLILTTAVSYLIANLVAYFLGDSMVRKHYSANLFGKICLKPLDCVLAVISVLGVQMLSALLQWLMMSISGISGIDESTASMLSISDHVLQNVILVLYTVVIAAITEELLCRGVVMKALSVRSKTFGLVASSLLFGIMHGNLNQIFNGFLLGMVIGYSAVKSRSIFLPILLHMCANGHAMVWSFLEYAFGESVLPVETVYMVAMAAAGLAAMVLLVIRNGKPDDQMDGYPVTAELEGLEELENKKGLTWKLLLKSPLFWGFLIIYTFTSAISLTAIG